MNPLRTVQRRALLAAALTMGGIVLVVLAYWQSVSAGALPAPTRPLVATPKSAATMSNAPPVKISARPEAPQPVDPPPPSSSTAPAPPSVREQPAPAVDQKNVAPPSNPPPTTLATPSAPARPLPVEPAMEPEVTRTTPDDERLARQWLASTNQRPTVLVHYQPADILRLSTELGRGLLVAGRGTSPRREVFLQPKAGAPLFSPFTPEVADEFSRYSLALRPAAAFAPVTTPLSAYFPEHNFDLAFVPGDALATEIFAKTAQAIRSRPQALAHPHTAVVEGQLVLRGDLAAFEPFKVE